MATKTNQALFAELNARLDAIEQSIAALREAGSKEMELRLQNCRLNCAAGAVLPTVKPVPQPVAKGNRNVSIDTSDARTITIRIEG